MTEKIGVAFVGCTHPHIFPRYELLSQESDVEMVGCFDPDPALRQALEVRYSLKAYDRPEALLDHPRTKLVLIEGWDTDNPEYAREALRRGKAVMLEKPGAPNLREMKALTAEFRNQPVVFQVSYMLRHSPVMPHLKRILDDGVLGVVTLARFHAAAPVGGAREVWQSVPGDMGGAVFTDGCHMIDTIVNLLGVPQKAKGMLLKLPEGPNVVAHGFKRDTLSELGETVEMPLGGLMYEDAGAGMLDYGDKLVTFDLTGWEAHPWVEAWKVEIYGTDGTLHAGLQPPWYRLYLRNPKKGWEPGWHTWEGFGVEGVGISLVVDDCYRNEIQHMLSRVRTWDTNSASWFDEAEGVVAVLDAIFRSADQDNAVNLD